MGVILLIIGLAVVAGMIAVAKNNTGWMRMAALIGAGSVLVVLVVIRLVTWFPVGAGRTQEVVNVPSAPSGTNGAVIIPAAVVAGAWTTSVSTVFYNNVHCVAPAHVGFRVRFNHGRPNEFIIEMSPQAVESLVSGQYGPRDSVELTLTQKTSSPVLIQIAANTK